VGRGAGNTPVVVCWGGGVDPVSHTPSLQTGYCPPALPHGPVGTRLEPDIALYGHVFVPGLCCRPSQRQGVGGGGGLEFESFGHKWGEEKDGGGLSLPLLWWGVGGGADLHLVSKAPWLVFSTDLMQNI
jgi:hypothetical protein